jgi:hypothetical protein
MLERRSTDSRYGDHVNDETVTMKLTPDQAFVLSDWLYEVMDKSDQLSALVTDRAVWSPLYTISGTLDKALPEVFVPDYVDRLNAARRRLLEAMGGEDEPTQAEPEP